MLTRSVQGAACQKADWKSHKPICRRQLAELSSRSDHPVQDLQRKMLKWMGNVSPAIQTAGMHALQPTAGGLTQPQIDTHALLVEIKEASGSFEITSAKVVAMDFLEIFHPTIGTLNQYRTDAGRKILSEKVGEDVAGLMIGCIVCWVGRKCTTHLGQYVITTKQMNDGKGTKFDPDWAKKLKDHKKYKWFITPDRDMFSIPVDKLGDAKEKDVSVVTYIS